MLFAVLLTISDLPLGTYQYKFFVDYSRWCFDIKKPIVKDAKGNINNCIQLQGLVEVEIVDGEAIETVEEPSESLEEVSSTSESESETEGKPKAERKIRKFDKGAGDALLALTGEKKERSLTEYIQK